MKFEVRIEIDDIVCEAEIVDPHGNVEMVAAPGPETLMHRVRHAVLDSYEACALAEEENAS